MTARFKRNYDQAGEPPVSRQGFKKILRGNPESLEIPERETGQQAIPRREAERTLRVPRLSLVSSDGKNPGTLRNAKAPFHRSDGPARKRRIVP